MKIKVTIALLHLLLWIGLTAAANQREPAAARAAADPAGHWRFEEGSGTTTADEAAAANHGVLTNGAAWATNVAPIDSGNSWALQFDGVNDYVQIGPGIDNTLMMTDALTIAAWIYPTGSGGQSYNIILNKEGEYELARFPDGTIRWAVYNTSPGWNWQDTGFVAPLNTWTHVAFVYSLADASGATYANGVPVDVRPVAGQITDHPSHLTNDDLRIGARQGNGRYFQGVIDEVQLYDRALSQAQIWQTTGLLRPAVSILKQAADATVFGAAAITYTLTFENAGNGVATNVLISDTLPAAATGFTMIGSSGATITQTSAAPNITWQLADLPPGAGGTISYTLTAPISDTVTTLENVVAISTALPAWRPQSSSDAFVRVCPRTPAAATTAALNSAIGCYNDLNGPGTMTVTLTTDLLLAQPLTTIDNGTPGLSLFVDGADHTIDGDFSVRPLTIAAATEVTISRLSLQNGFDYNCGGLIFSAGMLTLQNSNLLGDTFTYNAEKGGAVCSVAGATLHVQATRFEGSVAGEGSAINSSGLLTVVNSTFISNTRRGSLGQFTTVAVISQSGNALTVSDSTFLQNLDGAISSRSAAVTISGSLFEQNDAEIYGGAIALVGGSATIGASLFRDNQGAFGGAVYSLGVDDLLIEASTFVANDGTTGGAILVVDGSAAIVNSTISDNSAEDGGGITVDESVVTLINSTVSANTATTGGGILVTTNPFQGSATLHLTNTIAANNSGGDCIIANRALLGSATNNLIESTGANACAIVDNANGNQTGVDPLLGPLQDNGGATATRALLAGSLAIDSGDNTTCSAAPVNAVDQRGYSRSDAACDIGAFEAGGVPLAIAISRQGAATLSALSRLPLFLALLLTAGLLLRRRCVAHSR